MAIRNSLFTRKNLNRVGLFLLSGSLLSCQSLKTADQIHREKQQPIQQQPQPPMPKEFGTEKELPPPPPVVEKPPEIQAPKVQPKIAVIFGPGGLRAYAFAGVLQEMHRMHVPIVAIGGLEMGALAAVLYANKPQSFESEWQMMKLKEADFVKRGLISGAQPKDLQEWREWLKSTFGSARLEDTRIPFGCITINVEKQNVLIMNKGSISQALPYCLAFPPFFKVYDRHAAGAANLGSLVRYFKGRGATHVLYVDVLSDKTNPMIPLSSENSAVLWTTTASSIELQTSYANDVLRIPLTDEITAFDKRRDMIQRGREWTAKSLPAILQKMGIEL